MAETCQLVEGTFVMPLPDELDDALACTASCAGATVPCGLRPAAGCRDEVVLVHGAGAVGLYACAMASGAGARAVVAVAVDPTRLQLARAFGKSHTALSGAGSLRKTVSKLSCVRGADTASDASGATEAAGTVVTDGERVHVNRTGNPGMATAGTGDVLSGVLGAYLAACVALPGGGEGSEPGAEASEAALPWTPFDAAVSAVHVHGLAGDLAAEALGRRALIASDLVDHLPAAQRALAGD